MKPNVKFWGWTKQINFVGLKMLSTSPLRFLDCCVISSIVLQRFFPLAREQNWKHGARTPSNLKLRTNVLLCYHYGTFVFVNTHTHMYVNGCTCIFLFLWRVVFFTEHKNNVWLRQTWWKIILKAERNRSWIWRGELLKYTCLRSHVHACEALTLTIS